jgi:hypothetical protein
VVSPQFSVGLVEAELGDGLERWREDQRLWCLAAREGKVPDDELARIEDLRRDVRLRARLEARIAPRLASPTAEELRVLFESRSDGWFEPAQMAIRVLRVPLRRDSDPALQERRLLEQSRAAEELAVVASTLGHTIEDVGPLPEVEIAGAIGPLVFGEVKELAPGQISAPIHDLDHFVVVQMRERMPRRRLSFDEARPRLEEQWRAQKRRELQGREVASVLEGLVITTEGERWLATP